MEKIGIKERVNAFGNVGSRDLTEDEVMKPEGLVERGIEEDIVGEKRDKP